MRWAAIYYERHTLTSATHTVVRLSFAIIADVNPEIFFQMFSHAIFFLLAQGCEPSSFRWQKCFVFAETLLLLHIFVFIKLQSAQIKIDIMWLKYFFSGRRNSQFRARAEGKEILNGMDKSTTVSGCRAKSSIYAVGCSVFTWECENAMWHGQTNKTVRRLSPFYRWNVLHVAVIHTSSSAVYLTLYFSLELEILINFEEIDDFHILIRYARQHSSASTNNTRNWMKMW